MSTSEKSDWSIVGLAHKFGLAWERAGGTLADVNRIAENVPLLTSIIGVLRGTHEIKPRKFPTWRVIKLGLHKTPKAYLASIKGRGREPNKYARDIAAETTCSQEVVDLPLVDVSGADLGFTDFYTYREFLERADTFGLYPCPAEAGLALANQYDDQPQGDYRRIGMEGIADSVGDLHVFDVGRVGGGLCLRTRSGRPEDQWDPGRRWVLTARKP